MNKFFSSKVRNTLNVLHECIYKTLETVPFWYYGECEYKGSSYLPDTTNATEKKIVPIMCGGYDKHFIVRNTVEIPSPSIGNEVVIKVKTGRETQWDAINPQFMLYVDNELIQGLDVNHTESVLQSGIHEILIYGYTGMRKDALDFPMSIEICEINKLCEKVWYDLKIAFECFENLNTHSVERANLYRNIECTLNMIDLSVPGSEAFYQSLRAASAYMDKNIFCGTKSNVEVYEVGHTHIDVAWLWTLAQTEEKAQRSFATVIKFMEQYPDYIFMSSQPQLYKYVKNAAPALYAKIKKAIAEGRWEPEGAMWLEADCNITSGESFIRQLLHGKNFFKEEFGVDSHVLWLPDVFGYSAALPQILKKCGVDTFVTSKISWNEYNKMPYDAFMWEGIDGSEIFTYFMTACNKSDDYEKNWITTYLPTAAPSMAIGSWERFQQKEYSNKALVTYGKGDGGGGPTKDDLEYTKRLSKGVDGIPQYKLAASSEFLSNLMSDFNRNSKLLGVTPKWVGELYLEFHRGTYTSVAKLKKQMRKSEFLLKKAETLSSTASILLGKAYPSKELYDNWETVCLNQFHDILPGSSIFEVYEDSDRQMKEVIDFGKKLEQESLNLISSNIKKDSGIIVYNPTSFKASGIAEVDGRRFIAKDVPPFGWCVVSDTACENDVIIGDRSLENSFYSLKFDDMGNITSLYDKRQGKEYVESGKAINVLEVSEDYPRAYDAWEITDYYKQKTNELNELSSFEPISDEILGGFKITRRYNNSVIVQKVILYAGKFIDRIDVETEIDWKESHKLLKAAFPVNVHSSDVTCDIQFGSIKRPTHQNTSWDAAKFEFCAHKYVDISDNGAGFAVLNDCKYGYSAEGNTIKLTLLKCATYPNPEADKHLHKFTYSLYPHRGSLATSDTIMQSYLLNAPFSAIAPTGDENVLAENYSFIESTNRDIVIETVKKAENSDDIVVRMYESSNCQCETTINFGFDVEKVYITDMLENEQTELIVRNNSVNISASNFEIITLKIKPSNQK